MISTLFRQLEKTPSGALYNPWRDYDPEHEQSGRAPSIRRRQLEIYLEERVGRTRYLFVAEALGYQGGHFTGIAMTSERILLGHQQRKYGVSPGHVFRSINPERTSRSNVRENGMSEPTATIMWSTLLAEGLNPFEVVLWNALPWHPYRPERGLLSNRTPNEAEMAAGLPVLETFLSIFDGARVIAVGRKCELALAKLDVECQPVRHPANGGAPRFREQVAGLNHNRSDNPIGRADLG